MANKLFLKKNEITKKNYLQHFNNKYAQNQLQFMDLASP